MSNKGIALKPASLLVLGVILAALLGCTSGPGAGPDSSSVTLSPSPAATNVPTLEEPPADTATPGAQPTVDTGGGGTAPSLPAHLTPDMEPEDGAEESSPVLTLAKTPGSEGVVHHPEPPDRDLLELARSLVLKQDTPIPHVASASPRPRSTGDTDAFFAVDLPNLRIQSIQATLEAVTPHAYWYVEEGVGFSEEDLLSAARVFEEEIYPRVTSDFGSEWSPGIDADTRITILHVRLQGLAGYFSSVDEYPASAHPFSNEREMIYLDGDERFLGSSMYLSVLAHELQHLFQWNADPTEEAWVAEGLAELAAYKAGYQPLSLRAFLANPTTSLVNWPAEPQPAYYGADYLFFRYLYEHFGSPLPLSQEPLDGVAGIDSYLAAIGSGRTFRDVFRDWTVANLLDAAGDGPYSHPNAEIRVRDIETLNPDDSDSGSIPQYSAKYYTIDEVDEGLIIEFEGRTHTPVIPEGLVEGACWWGNRGDSISTTLSRELDLTQVPDATLSFRLWYEIEEGWDYAYLEVSVDDGSTWDILAAEGTSDLDLLGTSYGPGYTGASHGWEIVEASLSEYAGQEVIVRFHYVTDDALHSTGICVDHIAVPEIGVMPDASFDESWVAHGFRRIDNRDPQEYIVQIVEVGKTNVVSELRLNSDNEGQYFIPPSGELEKVHLIVAALARDTQQEAPFRVSITEAGQISVGAYGRSPY